MCDDRVSQVLEKGSLLRSIESLDLRTSQLVGWRHESTTHRRVDSPAYAGLLELHEPGPRHRKLDRAKDGMDGKSRNHRARSGKKNVGCREANC